MRLSGIKFWAVALFVVASMTLVWRTTIRSPENMLPTT